MQTVPLGKGIIELVVVVLLQVRLTVRQSAHSAAIHGGQDDPIQQIVDVQRLKEYYHANDKK